MRRTNSTNAHWALLEQELAAWRADGRTVPFWWRDDDAHHVTPSLERLLSLSEAADVPLALAVIPQRCDKNLLTRLAEAPSVSVLQHGWAHVNHAPSGHKKSEFGGGRSLPTVLSELSSGAKVLGQLDCALPVLVPPWNRIAEPIVARLPSIGISGLSLFGPRWRAVPTPGLKCTNVHLDIIDWRGNRRFVGLAAAVAQVHNHLYKKRIGEVDPSEPTGLMSHHLCHDDECWWFIAEFIERTKSLPSVRWLDAGELLCM